MFFAASAYIGCAVYRVYIGYVWKECSIDLYRICRFAYCTAGQLLDAYAICCDVCTADRKLDIGY